MVIDDHPMIVKSLQDLCLRLTQVTGVLGRRLGHSPTIAQLAADIQVGEESVEGQTPPPATVSPGQTVTVQIRAFEAVGEGIMRWAPINQQNVAEWGFEVESD